MNKKREIDGIKIVVNGEQYEAYKGTLQDQINELQNKIDKAKRYIKEHSTTLDYKTMKADYNLNMNGLLDILKGDNK